jgi:hypothetical protein
MDVLASMMRALDQAGALQNSQPPMDAVMGGDQNSLEQVRCCSFLPSFRTSTNQNTE